MIKRGPTDFQTNFNILLTLFLKVSLVFLFLLENTGIFHKNKYIFIAWGLLLFVNECIISQLLIQISQVQRDITDINHSSPWSSTNFKNVKWSKKIETLFLR